MTEFRGCVEYVDYMVKEFPTNIVKGNSMTKHENMYSWSIARTGNRINSNDGNYIAYMPVEWFTVLVIQYMCKQPQRKVLFYTPIR